MPPSKKKWLIRIFIAGFLFWFLVGAYFYWDWKSTRAAGEARLAKVLAELDSSEPGWRDLFSGRNERLAPKDRNAAYLVRDRWNALPPAFRDSVRSGSLAKDYRAADKADPNRLWPAPAIDAMRKMLGPHDGDLAAIRAHLSNPSNAGFPFDRAIGLAATRDEWDVMTCLAIGRWLQSDARVCLADGRADVAVADVRAMIGLCRAIGDEPTIVAQLQRMAMAIMALPLLEAGLGHAEPKDLSTLQQKLFDESLTPCAEIMLRGERLGTDEMFAELDRALTPEFQMSRAGPAGRSIFPNARDAVDWHLARKHLPGQRAIALERATSLLHATRRPYREFVARKKEMEAEADREPETLILNLATIVLGEYAVRQFDSQAHLRTAAAAVACERYRRQFGHWPRDLGEIPTSILPGVPRDPYDDAPLRLANTTTGLVVYSVGSDLKDDGSSLKKNAAGGMDVGFRLYDPAHRRVP
jgi:hypothetical protein